MSTKKLQLLENIFPANPQAGQVLSIDTDGNKTWRDIPEQVQSDWNENDETSYAYILNKPLIATDSEVIDTLIEIDALYAVQDSDGALLADETGNILLW